MFVHGATALTTLTKTRPVTANALLAAEATATELLPGGTPRSRPTADTPHFLLIPRSYVKHIMTDTLTPIGIAQWIGAQTENWPEEFATTKNEVKATLQSLVSHTPKDPFSSQLSIACTDNRNFGEKVTTWFQFRWSILAYSTAILFCSISYCLSPIFY